MSAAPVEPRQRLPVGGPLDLAESAAGEEDPGAAVDVALAAGTPGTGEDVCPRCGGSGTLTGGACPDCQGTGKVTVGTGGV